MRRFCWVGAAVWMLLGTGLAVAMPAPMDEEELNALADIVVDAEVVAVECVGVVEVPGELKQAKLRSTHQVLETHWGEAPDTFYIDFFVDLIPIDIAGCAWREPPHWVGEQATLWLDKAAEDGEVYALFNWSGIEGLENSAPVEMTDEEMTACAADPDPEPDPEPDPDPKPNVNTAPDDGGGSGCTLTSKGSSSGLLMATLALMALLGWRFRRVLG